MNLVEVSLLILENSVFCLGHISIDVMVNRVILEQLKIGGTIESPDLSLRGGGDAANVSYWLGKIGTSVAMIGVIGDDPAGLFLKNDLERANVYLKLKISTKYPSATILIIVEQDGERSFIINGRSQNDLEWKDLPIQEIIKSRLFYTSAYTIESDPIRSTIFRLFSYLKSDQKSNVQTMFNLAAYTTVEKCEKEIKSKILPFTDILVGNKEEFNILNKNAKGDFHNISRNLAEEYTNLDIILITDGANGCYYLFNNEEGHIKPPKTSVIDTTGSGDGFCAGFISKYISGDTIDKSVKKGLELGSAICQKYGARYRYEIT